MPTRTLQGGLLLRPSPELNDFILGVIGKAQDTYKMTIHAFVVVSNHAHLLVSPSSAQRACPLHAVCERQHRQRGHRLHDWPDRVSSRRYRAIPVVDDEAAHARIRYQLSHGAKEGLVATAGSWPGPNCIAALTHGDRLQGTWHDRSAEYRARAAGREIKPGDFTTAYDVKLTPLPCIIDKSVDQQQAHYRRVVREIDDAAAAASKEEKRTPMGVQAILHQNPHHRPDAPDRSPAPLVHAHDDEKRDVYLHAYRVFVINFRTGVDSMKAKAKQIIDMFPDWAFPPALPFKAAAPSAVA